MTKSITNFLSLARRAPAHSPIAIELDGGSVRAVQLARGRDGRNHLHAVADFILPSTDADRSALRNILHRRGFVGDDLILCAPSRILDSDLLQLPETKSVQSLSATADTIRSQLARGTRTAPSDMELAFWPRKGEFGPTAYAVALRHSEARRLIDPFQAAGCNVVSIGCAASALGELLHHFGHADSCSAVLRLGQDAHLLVLCQGRDVIYQRTLDAAGWKAVLPADSDATAVQATPPVRAHLALVAEETSSTLQCVPRTFGNLAVSRLLVSGERAAATLVLDYLRQSLPAATALDLSHIPVPPGSPKLAINMDIALGLALSEVAP